MPVRVIETASEDALHRRYDSQSSPQDCYIELDLREGTLLADYNSEVGNAVPGAVRHGFEIRYPIPALTGSAADELMYRIAPLAERIVADWEQVRDGNNMVARLGEDAQAADAEIGAEIGYDPEDDYTDPADLIQVWDVDGACNGTEVEDYGITADTTDERLGEIEEEIRKSLQEVSDGVVVLDGVAEYLQDKRAELVAELFEELTEAAEEAAELANAAALKRAQAAARMYEVSRNQTEAAQRLGMDRSTLSKLITKAKAAESSEQG